MPVHTEALLQDSLPAHLKNMNSGQIKQMFINPEQLNLVFAAGYTARDLKGMGTVPLDYDKGENPIVSFDIYVNLLHIMSKGRADLARAKKEMSEWRNFLTSLIFPYRSKVSGGVGGQPPKVWFYYPQSLSLIGRITNVSWNINQFQLDGTPIQQIANVTFKEDGDHPWWNQIVNFTGWQQGSSISEWNPEDL